MTALSPMFRGDTKTFTVTITDGGNPQPLTGCVVEFTAKLGTWFSTPLISKTTADGSITVNSNVATITISPADTSSLTRDTHLVWDVQFTDTAGNKATINSGTLLVQMDVSP